MLPVLKLRRLQKQLDDAADYATWCEVAAAIDALTGAEDWRKDDEADFFHAESLRRDLDHMRWLRGAGDAAALAEVVHASMHRNLVDLLASDGYSVALGGPKHLARAYLDETENTLRWLASDEAVLPLEQKRSVFDQVHHTWGRSALMLSGGATFGFMHLGVCKALHRHRLLPDVVSGASTGAMIAAGICTRDDDELDDLFDRPEQMELIGLVPRDPADKDGGRSLLDPERLLATIRKNINDGTFEEARAHSGRTLVISVSPTRKRQLPRVLCPLTSPNVLVSAAALASSALPVFFPPVTLTGKNAEGEEVPWLPEERWADGSVWGDIPTRSLGRLYNVDHFIVSQTNPHVLPFLTLRDGDGWVGRTFGMAGRGVQQQTLNSTEMARRLTERVPGLEKLPLGTWLEHVHALANQSYSGDVDIHPAFRPGLYRKIMSNPTPELLDQLILDGERATWPHLEMIRDQTRISRCLTACRTKLA